VWVHSRLPPWRCSADRTRLHVISLLPGNLTGNFANLRHLEVGAVQETAVSSNSLSELTGKTLRGSGNSYPTTGNLLENKRPFLRRSSHEAIFRQTGCRRRSATCRPKLQQPGSTPGQDRYSKNRCGRGTREQDQATPVLGRSTWRQTHNNSH